MHTKVSTYEVVCKLSFSKMFLSMTLVICRKVIVLLEKMDETLKCHEISHSFIYGKRYLQAMPEFFTSRTHRYT